MPEFYVFYNGTEAIETNQTLKLSDSFIAQTKVPRLELIVQLLNINYENDNPILKSCKPLKEYRASLKTWLDF